MDSTANQKKRPQFVTEVVPDPNQQVQATENSPFAAPQATQAGGHNVIPAEAGIQYSQEQPDRSRIEVRDDNTNVIPAQAGIQKPKSRKFKFRPSPSNFIFVIPALILVATIAIVAYVTRTDYVVREPDPVVDTQTFIPVPTPGATAMPDISYLNYANDQYTFMYPDKFQLAECSDSVNLYPVDTQSDEICQRTDFIISLNKINQRPDYLSNEELVASESAVISGTEFTKYEIKASGSNTVYLPFEIGEDTYQFVLRDIIYRTEFLDILQSFKILIDVTADWKTYNDPLGYSIKYPEDWFLLAVDEEEVKNVNSLKTEIRRIEDESRFQNLIIEANINLENAPISASQAVSSTRSLAGWDETPASELRDLGGANAQIIKGSFNGIWNVFAVIWYRNNMIQITWEDTLDRSYDQVLEQMLNSMIIE